MRRGEELEQQKNPNGLIRGQKDSQHDQRVRDPQYHRALGKIKEQNLIEESSDFMAGQINNKLQVWKAQGASKSLLSILSGYKLPFVCTPPLKRFTPDSCSRMASPISAQITIEVIKMLKCEAIEVCKSHSGFLSPIFLRKKSDGTNRLIFNLKLLNNHLNPPKFHLINHQKIPLCINDGDYMLKIDLSQAYFHIPIVEPHRKFLAFSYYGIIYQMTCLPFGLATAPYVFARVTNWVANCFREKGIKIVVYLDDFLIIHHNPVILSQQSNFIHEYLTKLGWHINVQKSVLVPSQKIEYLGIIWDTKLNLKQLPNPKIRKVTTLIQELLKNQSWTWWLSKVLLGNLNFASFVVPLGRLHCRQIQIAANRLSKKEKHKKALIPAVVVKECQWWLQNIQRSSAIHQNSATIFITTDAAGTGWGATVNNWKLQGRWNKVQRNCLSNHKELWAVLKVLQRMGSLMENQTAMIQTDNKSVVAYINKEGGTKSPKLLKITREIFRVTEHLHVTLIARYIPGRYNSTADTLSRSSAQPEWSLNKSALLPIFRKWGTPTVDLFASARSAIVNSYVSEDARDPNCLFVDAFSRLWNYKLRWIFPPPALIPRVLQHLAKSKGTYLLVTPQWERPFWKTDVKQRAQNPPFRIPKLYRNLMDLTTGRPPPEIKDLCLQVWRVRAGPV
jgi:hypothetical protein